MPGRDDKDGGFTLIELASILAIIGVVVTIAIATYTTATARATAVTCENNRRFLDRVASSEYRVEHGVEPASIEDLAPYLSNWSIVRTCPSDDTQYLFLDGDANAVACPIHGK